MSIKKTDSVGILMIESHTKRRKLIFGFGLTGSEYFKYIINVIAKNTARKKTIPIRTMVSFVHLGYLFCGHVSFFAGLPFNGIPPIFIKYKTKNKFYIVLVVNIKLKSKFTILQRKNFQILG